MRGLHTLTLVAGVTLVLAGCATPGYECKKPLACNPVHRNYQKSVSDTAWNGWQAGNDNPATAGKDGSKQGSQKAVVQAAAAGALRVPGGDALSGPVYTAPRPWRVWLAPYSRGDGTLESGTYIWFTTPGHWTYLGRNWIAPPFASAAPDANSTDGETLHPLAPDALGFTPGKATAPTGVLNNIQQPNADGSGQ